MNKLRFLAIIPARYASTRFPGKPLAMLDGKTMIQRVYERVSSEIQDVYVATDDERIALEVERFGGKCVITSPLHTSGTDRCYEAFTKINGSFDVVINVQGDEPFIHPEQISLLKNCFDDPKTEIATLVKPYSHDDIVDNLATPNTPKVVISKDNYALYFSRSIIPYKRGTDRHIWLQSHTYYKHIGIYAYKHATLKELTQLEPSSLEKAESLEQLRWLENGYRIKVAITEHETFGIDTPDDLEHAIAFLKKNKKTD
jgi:3-deoxy-manno-octulosonate cytidylyltransferase (CMP-KDO synthetase)